MKRAILILLALIGLASMAWGQTPMEAAEGATVMELNAAMETEAGAATFTVGDQDTVRSGIYNAWKETGVLITVVGDSSQVKMYVYGGDCERSGDNSAQADDDTKQFALMDSLTVTAAGNYIRQVSDYMSKCRWFYLEFVGQTDNGHETYVEEVKAMRERY